MVNCRTCNTICACQVTYILQGLCIKIAPWAGHVCVQVIAQFIVDKWAHAGPSLRASTPEARATASLATRINDVYLMPLLACLYKKMDASQVRQLHSCAV